MTVNWPQQRLKVYAFGFTGALSHRTGHTTADKIHCRAGGLEQGRAASQRAGEHAGKQVAGAGEILRNSGCLNGLHLTGVPVIAQGTHLPGRGRRSG